jgi:hypothetical protein
MSFPGKFIFCFLHWNDSIFSSIEAGKTKIDSIQINFIPDSMKQKISHMNLKKQIHSCLILIVFLFSFTICNAQNRPSLFLREDWKEISAATPVTQEHVVNKDLILGLYGPGRDSIKKSHHVNPADDPYYIWSGLCKGNWLVTLKKAKSYADLSGHAKIIWRSE